MKKLVSHRSQASSAATHLLSAVSGGRLSGESAQSRNEPRQGSPFVDLLGTPALYSISLPSREKVVEGVDELALQNEVGIVESAGNSIPRRAEVRVHPREFVAAREFEILQQWEGVVSEIHHDHFEATIYSVKDPEQIRPSEARFSLADIAPGDHELLVRGAVFTWTVGRESSPYPATVEIVKFHRLPMWTQTDVKRIWNRAHELRRMFGDTGSDQQTKR